MGWPEVQLNPLEKRRRSGARAGRLVLVLTAVAALVLAACGGDDDAAAVDTTTTTTTTVATTLPPTTLPPTTTTAPPPPTTTAPPPPTKPAVPPCDRDLLVKAYNDKAQTSDPYVSDSEEEPECRGGVAMVFVSQTDDSEGNPDFGKAIFVAKDGRWLALARYRPGGEPDVFTDDRVVPETTAEQRKILGELLDADSFN